MTRTPPLCAACWSSSPRECPSDNKSYQFTISSFGDPDVDHVIIQLTNGFSTVVGSAAEYIWS